MNFFYSPKRPLILLVLNKIIIEHPFNIEFPLFSFQIIGLVIVGASVYMLTDPTFLLSFTQPYNHYSIALYIFLGIGILITLGAFFGCCGVVKESQCLLMSVSMQIQK